MKKLIKNKLLVLFLTFILLFTPNKFTFALPQIAIGLIIGGAVLLGGVGLGWWWQSRGGFAGMSLDIIYAFLFIILPAAQYLFNLISRYCAVIINTFILLDPFGKGGIAMILWDFFRNITYVVLVFLGLYAGFNWILNKEDVARSLLVGIILVALIINFTFLLAKEVFFIFWHLQRGLLISANLVKPDQQKQEKGEPEVTELGNLIFAALSFVPPEEVSDKLVTIAQSMFSQEEGGNPHNVNKVFAITGKFLGILLSIVYSMIMAIFAGITIGRYLIISFLVGTIPVASLAYLIPQYRSYWNQWWQFFLTWNYNILVLIVLILVGVSLIATTTGEFTSQKLSNYFLEETNVKILSGQGVTRDLAIAFGELSKFAVIFLYFVFIIFVGQRLGNVFAYYSYFLTRKAWLFAGGLGALLGKYLARTGVYGGTYLAPSLAGVLDKAGERLLKSRLGTFRPVIDLAGKLKEAGEKIGAGAKEAEEKRAKRIYEIIKDLTPQEQAEKILKYKGALQQQLTKLVLGDLDEDEAAILTNALIDKAQGWDKLSSGMQKTLCGKFKCRLIGIQKAKTPDERVKEVLSFARMISWRKMDAQRLGSLLGSLNVPDEEMGVILESMVEALRKDRSKAALFFSNYQNIRGLAQNLAQKGGSLDQYSYLIKATPTYRSIESTLERELRNAGITNKYVIKQIIDTFFDYYIGKTTLPGQQQPPSTKNELEQIFGLIWVPPGININQQNLANQIGDILGLP